MAIDRNRFVSVMEQNNIGDAGLLFDAIQAGKIDSSRFVSVMEQNNIGDADKLYYAIKPVVEDPPQIKSDITAFPERQVEIGLEEQSDINLLKDRIQAFKFDKFEDFLEVSRLADDQTVPEEVRNFAEDKILERTGGKALRFKEEDGKIKSVSKGLGRQIAEAAITEPVVKSLTRGQNVLQNIVLAPFETLDIPLRSLGALSGKGKVSDPETFYFNEEVKAAKEGFDLVRGEKIRIDRTIDNLKRQLKDLPTGSVRPFLDEIKKLEEQKKNLGSDFKLDAIDFMTDLGGRLGSDPFIIIGAVKGLAKAAGKGIKAGVERISKSSINKLDKELKKEADKFAAFGKFFEGLQKTSTPSRALSTIQNIEDAVSKINQSVLQAPRKAVDKASEVIDDLIFRGERTFEKDLVSDLIVNKEKHLKNFKDVSTEVSGTGVNPDFASDITSSMFTIKDNFAKDNPLFKEGRFQRFPEIEELRDVEKNLPPIDATPLIEGALKTVGTRSDVREFVDDAIRKVNSEDFLKAFSKDEAAENASLALDIFEKLGKPQVSIEEAREAISQLDDILASKNVFTKKFNTPANKALLEIRQNLDKAVFDVVDKSLTGKNSQYYRSLREGLEKKASEVSGFAETLGRDKKKSFGLSSSQFNKINDKTADFVSKIFNSSNLKKDRIEFVKEYRQLRDLQETTGIFPDYVLDKIRSKWLLDKAGAVSGETVPRAKAVLPGNRILPERDLIKGDGIITTPIFTALNSVPWGLDILKEVGVRKNLKKTEALLKAKKIPEKVGAVAYHAMTNAKDRLVINTVLAMTDEQIEDLRREASKKNNTKMLKTIDDALADKTSIKLFEGIGEFAGKNLPVVLETAREGFEAVSRGVDTGMQDNFTRVVPFQNSVRQMQSLFDGVNKKTVGDLRGVVFDAAEDVSGLYNSVFGKKPKLIRDINSGSKFGNGYSLDFELPEANQQDIDRFIATVNDRVEGIKASVENLKRPRIRIQIRELNPITGEATISPSF